MVCRRPGPGRGSALRSQAVLTAVSLRSIPALLEDARASILLEALGALGCEYHLEPQRPARSLRWTRAKPDPCPCTVSVLRLQSAPLS